MNKTFANLIKLLSSALLLTFELLPLAPWETFILLTFISIPYNEVSLRRYDLLDEKKVYSTCLLQ